MTDYVRQALATNLGIKESLIGTWRLSATGNCIDFIEGFAAGTIEASLHIQLQPGAYKQLRDDQSRDGNPLFISNLTWEHCGRHGPQVVGIDVLLLRGAATEEFFKALAQQFTVCSKKSKMRAIREKQGK